MSVTVVLPFAGSCPHRNRSLRYVLARYAREFPEWRTVIGYGGKPWVKANAVTPAVEATHSDVVVVADSDCWTAGLASAVRAVTCGVAEWAIPHRTVKRLDEDSTTAHLGDRTYEPSFARQPYTGREGGGITVLGRATYLNCPLDPRYVGWGQEDDSWALALRALHGEPWRGDADLIHLWHPPEERLTHRRGSAEGWRLYRRYLSASDPTAMAQLIGEFRDRQPSQHPLHPAAA